MSLYSIFLAITYLLASFILFIFAGFLKRWSNKNRYKFDTEDKIFYGLIYIVFTGAGILCAGVFFFVVGVSFYVGD